MDSVGHKLVAIHVGTLICFDENIEKMRRFEYAKCFVEICPDNELPEMIQVGNSNGRCVHLEYSWRPMICMVFKCFGHATATCDMNPEQCDSKETNKIAEKVHIKHGVNNRGKTAKSVIPPSQKWQKVTLKSTSTVDNINFEILSEAGKETVPFQHENGNKKMKMQHKER